MFCRSTPLVLSALCVVAAACSDSSTAPSAPPASTETIVVDASQGYAYIALGNPAHSVTVTDPPTSTAWDMGFSATSVTLNGGHAGPGGVSGFCLCANATATTAQLQTMTAENQLAAFDAVTSAAVPSAAAFQSDQLAPAISGWFAGAGAVATAVTTRSWIVRRGSAPVLLAKLQVTGIQDATATTAGEVTLRYAVQSAPGADFGPSQEVTLDTRAGPVYFDLSLGSSSTNASWDLELDGFNIRLNSGVSGPGLTLAVLDTNTPFAQIDAAYAATAPVQAYRGDSYSGAFAAQPWYRYNITGSDNQIWPTYDIYLVRRGSDVYAVQLTSYYGVNGAARQISVRYRLLG